MWRFAVGYLAVCGLAGCNQLFGIPEATEGDLSHHLSGKVRGLWDGADGVALRLQADGVDQLLTVAANGDFQFASSLATGVSYTVTVATNPARHTCVVDAGSNGVVAEADITNLAIACTGPAVNVAISGPSGWLFDPTQDTQMFTGSIIAEEVELTISGDLTTAGIDSTSVDLGKPAPAIALPLGPTTVMLALAADGGLSKTYQLVFDRGGSAIAQAMYGKASSTQGSDYFGVSVAVSGDTLVVGAYDEAGGSKGVNGDPLNKTAISSGAVYVFIDQAGKWVQQAYIKASNTDENDKFGVAVSLEGDTLAVGALEEASGGDGASASQTDNSAFGAGAVYVFVRSGTTWSQQAYLKASNSDAGDNFGTSVSLSGNTLAVGADYEASNATGMNGNQASNTAAGAGAVYVFTRAGVFWSEEAYLKASNTGANDTFGGSISLDGDTLVVGAGGEASAATGVNGNQADNTAVSAGAAYVFTRSGTAWTQQAYLKASNTDANDFFGSRVAISGDTIAVGAGGEASNTTGVNGNQSDNSLANAGATYVFVRSGTTWSQQAYLKASNSGQNAKFGVVALSGDLLAVGAAAEASAATGIDGNQADNTAAGAGAIYLFERVGATWTQKAYIKASNTNALDAFGSEIALSGNTLASGAFGEASGDVGINGNQADNSAAAAGAVYVFR